MNIIANTDTVLPGKEKLHLPFEDLLALMQQEGFVIKPDDYIEMLKVVEKYGSRGIGALKFLLAPLISTSETEQGKFYKIFDEYIITTQQQNLAQKKHRSRKLIIWGSVTGIALLTVVLLYIYTRPPIITPPPASFSISVNGKAYLQPNLAVPGDTLKLDASGIFDSGPKYDTTDLHLAWNTGEGWEHPDQRRISFPVTGTGDMLLQLKLESYKHGKFVSIDSQYLTVCNAIITSLKADKNDSFYPGDKIVLQPVIRGNKNSIKDHLWIVNDVDTLRQRGEILSYSFDSAGSYKILYKAQLDSLPSCTQTQTASFVVNKKNDNFRLSASSIGALPPPSSKMNPWLWALLILPVGGLLLAYGMHQRAKKKLAGELKEKTLIKDESVQPANSPPHDVPFENKDIESIGREPEMNLLFRAMRSKSEDECRVLNISKSIHSEIRSGGMPSLVFTNRMKHQEYLILVDKSNVNSQQFKLFEYLVKLLCEENLNIEKFYYRDFNMFYNENFPAGVALQRLVEIYKTDVLIIFGNAHQLIYPAWPAVEKEKSDLLKEWEFKAILTPVAYLDWGAKEDALKKEIILLPADIQGQVQLIQAIKEKQLQHDRYLRSFQQFYEPASWYFTDVNEIRTYLNDKVLFQWLCAICVYPKLKWEIIIEIGKVICKREGQPDKVNFSNLLKLVRIQWMQEGFVPEHTRLELLKQLSIGNEVAARETILQMLQYPDLYFKGHHFFEEEKKQQELTNQFILFTNDNEKYKQYEGAHSLFKARWQQGKIYDGPLRRYLDKREGDNWQTPVRINELNAGVNEYFESKKDIANKNISRKFRLAYASLTGMLLIIAGLLYFGKPLLQGKSILGVPLISTDTDKNYELSFTLNIDSCMTNPANFAEGLRGNFRITQNEYALDFVGNKAIASVPYSDASLRTGIVELSWDDNKRSVSDILNFSENNSLLLRTCEAVGKSTLNIRYYNPANNDTLSLLTQLLSNEYVIADQQPDSFSVSRVVYYTEADKTKAEAIASLVDSVLKGKIPVQYSPVKDTASAVPVLYLSFPAPALTNDWTVVAVNSLPRSLNEIWKGATNNRLMTISLVDGRAWYSTGDKNTFGTYNIIEASKKADITKLIVSANSQFRVFFLQNISGSGFRVCFSPDILKTKTDADKLELADCKNTMDVMELYYPPESERTPPNADASSSTEITKRFYYPLSPVQNLNANETRMVKDFINTQSGTNITAKADFKFNTFWSNLKLTSRRASIQTIAASDYRLSSLASITKPLPVERLLTRALNPNGTPFDRDYVDITLTRKESVVQLPKEATDPCLITYRDIDEAIKSGTACRLDISFKELEQIPTNLFNLRSLKYLDIRNNYLSVNDSMYLIKDLPRDCQLLFTPQKGKVQPPEPDWVFLQTLELDEKYRPSKESDYYMSSYLFPAIKARPDGRIKIVAYYEFEDERKDAEVTANRVQEYFQKTGGLAANKISTEVVRRSSQQQQQQQQQQKSPSSNSYVKSKIYVDVFGINMATPTK